MARGRRGRGRGGIEAVLGGDGSGEVGRPVGDLGAALLPTQAPEEGGLPLLGLEDPPEGLGLGVALLLEHLPGRLPGAADLDGGGLEGHRPEAQALPEAEQPRHELGMGEVLDGLPVDMRHQLIRAQAGLKSRGAGGDVADHVLDGVEVGGLPDVDPDGADGEAEALGALPDHDGRLEGQS